MLCKTEIPTIYVCVSNNSTVLTTLVFLAAKKPKSSLIKFCHVLLKIVIITLKMFDNKVLYNFIHAKVSVFVKTALLLLFFN